MIPAKTKAIFKENNEDLGISTKLTSLKVDNEGRFESHPVVTPIYHSSIYHLETLDDIINQKQNGYYYRRVSTPNSDELETIICQLEKGAGTIVFPSGMSAITTTVMCFLQSGDHVVAPSPVYSGTFSFFKNYFPKHNLEVTYVKDGVGAVERYRQAIKPNTKILFGETPCNPNMSLLDLEEFGKLGQEFGILTIVDGSLASPINQTPCELGVDISCHSCTKYMGGHSDILAGCSTVRTDEQYRKLKSWTMMLGASLSPYDQVLLLRSMRTLYLRMMTHNQNGMKVAEFLESHPKVAKVFYAGLKSHPQHELAKKMMMGFGGMISVILQSKDCAKVFVESTRLFTLAWSLGGVESLIEHVPTMTHGEPRMTEQERIEAGIQPGMVRLSVGIANVEDLVEDLKQALDKVPNC